MCVEITTPSMLFLRCPLNKAELRVWRFDGKLREPDHNALGPWRKLFSDQPATKLGLRNYK